jgi:hypothetical protein
LGDPVKPAVTGRFIELNTYVRKEEKSTSYNLSFYLRTLKNKSTLNLKAQKKRNNEN